MQTTSQTQRTLQVEADGGSRGNPGVAGYGALVRDPETGEILATDAQPLGRASNNVAEYSGLIAGLTMARQIDPEARVHALMDSKLVVEQMSGRWKIKHEDMRRLAAQARSIIPAGQVTYEWIPREKNKDADQLSNEAMDAGAAGTQWDPGASKVPVSAPGEGPGTTATSEKATEPSSGSSSSAGSATPTGRLHHVEIWVEDLAQARRTLGWLFEELGYVLSGEWSEGASYQGAGEYLVIERGPDVTAGAHDRLRPGLNHLAFRAGTRADVDRLAQAAQAVGFTLLFAEKHPFAGGRNHYAAYLEAPNGFEVELVADPA
ncbi:reverse transcriptase-like protein [Micrococcus terreus]|uniref:reverse transcriptase-like protein n=1 Tax=Micrococcus terreus TaxID=574650 RepID=UPI003017D124